MLETSHVLLFSIFTNIFLIGGLYVTVLFIILLHRTIKILGFLLRKMEANTTKNNEKEL